MATAIRNVSGLTPSCWAVVTAIGAITTAVAALLRTFDKVMVTTRMMVSNTTGGRPT